MIEVEELTAIEIAMVKLVAQARQSESLKKHLPDKHGADPSTGLALHITGAAGELAFAKAFNLYWSGSVNTFKKGGDVGSIQVRTRTKDYYDLIVRADDRDEDWFVLVTGVIPHFKVHGFMLGAKAKQDRWIQTYGGREPAWFVPQSELRFRNR